MTAQAASERLCGTSYIGEKLTFKRLLRYHPISPSYSPVQ